MKSIFRGKTLDRRYRIVGTLAKGGFGETYIAEDTRLPGNPRCVVKHLKPGNSNTALLESAKRLFLSEAETLQKLGRHDQIPQLLAYFEENREFYLVQELIEGHTLTCELVPGRSWSEPKIYSLLQELLEVLVFVHGQGVIHRDIKPDNILRRTHDHKLVLVDFGTVKQVVAQNQVSTTIIAGTPGYMPTEQGRGKPRPNSDLYALGIIGIQAATGLHPSELQEDPSTGEIHWRPSARCSDELAAILSRMVRYHFKERYQSAEAVLHDLEPLLDSVKWTPDAVVDQPPPAALADVAQATVLSPLPLDPLDSGAAISPLQGPEDDSQAGPAADRRSPSSDSTNAATILATASEPLETWLAPTETVISQQPPSPPAPAAAGAAPDPTPTLVSPAPTAVPPPTPTLVSPAPPLDSAPPIASAPAETIVSMPPRSAADPVPAAIAPDSPATAVSRPAAHEPASSSHADGTVISRPASDADRRDADRTVVSRPVPPPQPVLPAPDQQPAVTGRSRQFRWLLGAGTAVVAIGILAGSVSMWQQRQAYSKEQQMLEAAKTQQAQGNYQDCIQQAQQVSQRYADLYTTAQTASGDCQMALAQQLAGQSRFKQAIETASQIPAGHPAYQQAQSLLSEWAKGILKRATDRYQAGKLDEAVAMANAIPNANSIYSQAQADIKKWNAEWKTNTTRWQAVEKALQDGRWQTVLNEAKQLTTSHWQWKAKPSVDRANSEIAAAAERAAQRARSAPQSGNAPAANYSSGSSYSRSAGYESSGSSGYSAPAAPPASGGSGGGWSNRTW